MEEIVETTIAQLFARCRLPSEWNNVIDCETRTTSDFIIDNITEITGK